MSAEHDNVVGLSDQKPTGDYDGFAEAYAAANQASLLNTYYAQPAILDLAGEVSGRRILDVGCGTGPIFEALRERGAIVTGADPSVKMLELARKRLGEDAALQQADLNDPLPFADNAFDDVVACLVLHYLEDWTAPLAELRRVLAPGGRLIVAVNHPYVYKVSYPDRDYFSTHEWGLECDFDGQKVVLSQWHRPMPALIAAFVDAGFRISVLSEPPPAPDAYERFPNELKTPDARFLCFLFLVLESP